MQKDIRELTRMLQSEGLRLISLGRTGKSHYKALIEAPDGRQMTYVLANSGSDHRGPKNRQRDIVRFFNN